MGYSDHEGSLALRRQRSREDLQAGFDAEMAPYQDMLMAYYNGDENPLRDHAPVWLSSFNIGVNCKKKHLVLRLWEKDDVIIEYQW